MSLAQLDRLEVPGRAADVHLAGGNRQQRGLVDLDRRQERDDVLGLGSLQPEGVDDTHLVVDQLRQKGVAVGLAAHLLGHVQAVVLARLALGLGVTAALHARDLTVAVTGVARALLLVDLLARALDLATIERAGRTLTGVRVIANVCLLDQRVIDIRAEQGFIDRDRSHLGTLHVVDGDLHKSSLV
jgi:hypothetical protein